MIDPAARGRSQVDGTRLIEQYSELGLLLAPAENTVEADVEIARIEGDTAVKIAKIEAGVAEDMMESRVAALEGELRGMREALDRIAPEPQPEPQPEPAPAPVVIEEPEPEPEMPPREVEHRERHPSSRKGFF